MNSLGSMIAQNKLVVGVVAFILSLVIGFSAYQATPQKVTFSISQPDSTLTLNGKVYYVTSNGITLQLRRKDYQVRVEKPGYEVYDQAIHPESDTTIRIPLKIKTNRELTNALPADVNIEGVNFKAGEPAYFENGTWAVAQIVQFDVDSSEYPDLYAVFKKVSGSWQLVAGPTSEFAPEDEIDKLVPAKVYKYLESKL